VEHTYRTIDWVSFSFDFLILNLVERYKSGV